MQNNVDEKLLSNILEQSTNDVFKRRACVCSFTVVANAFLGLESTQFTYYDLILCNEDLQHLKSSHVLQILRKVGAITPIVEVIKKENPRVEKDSIDSGFFGILRTPFTNVDICNLIVRCLDKEKEVSPENLKSMIDAIYNSLSSSHESSDKLVKKRSIRSLVSFNSSRVQMLNDLAVSVENNIESKNNSSNSPNNVSKRSLESEWNSIIDKSNIDCNNIMDLLKAPILSSSKSRDARFMFDIPVVPHSAATNTISTFRLKRNQKPKLQQPNFESLECENNIESNADRGGDYSMFNTLHNNRKYVELELHNKYFYDDMDNAFEFQDDASFYENDD